MHFQKQVYSGICVCTHPITQHHREMVMNPKAIRQTGETRVALNCEFYDDGQGIDAHCSYYWDQANPLPDPYVMTRPTPPSKEWPTHPDL